VQACPSACRLQSRVTAVISSASPHARASQSNGSFRGAAPASRTTGFVRRPRCLRSIGREAMRARAQHQPRGAGGRRANDDGVSRRGIQLLQQPQLHQSGLSAAIRAALALLRRAAVAPRARFSAACPSARATSTCARAFLNSPGWMTSLTPAAPGQVRADRPAPPTRNRRTARRRRQVVRRPGQR
jgi:hypothetical protein